MVERAIFRLSGHFQWTVSKHICGITGSFVKVNDLWLVKSTSRRNDWSNAMGDIVYMYIYESPFTYPQCIETDVLYVCVIEKYVNHLYEVPFSNSLSRVMRTASATGKYDVVIAWPMT